MRKTKEEVEGRLIGEVLPLQDEIRSVLANSEAVVEKEVKITSEGKGKAFQAHTTPPARTVRIRGWKRKSSLDSEGRLGGGAREIPQA